MSNVDALMIEAEQENLFNNALSVVKTEAFEMKRCFDKNELMDGLRHASVMLSELRTSFLTPKFYYRLYIDVTNELQAFYMYLTDTYFTYDNTRKVADLYEMVQYTGNLIPRLYLLITVGVVYIKSNEVLAKDVLFDLVEMCRGVQHPLRGLFLRYYLLSSTKEYIPDSPILINGSLIEDVSDGIEFIMTNFSEMNKLWFRMQHLGPSKEKAKREKERKELRILVGTNLVRLSHLENLDLDKYKKIVLPGILEQSVSCKEPISQEYLIECVIQVFPENFHLHTLNEFLNACSELHSGVNIKNILTTLVDHLTMYIANEGFKNLSNDTSLFEIFSKHTEQVFKSRNLLVEDVISIQIALLNLALNCYNEQIEYADIVFASTSELLKKLNISNISYNSVIGRELFKLLKLPFQSYTDIKMFFKLSNYTKIFKLHDIHGQICVCSLLIKSLIEKNVIFDNEENVSKILIIIDSLFDNETEEMVLSNNELKEGQELVSKLIHLVQNEDPEQHFDLIIKMTKIFGNTGKIRLKYTLPSILWNTFKLLFRYAAVENSSERNLKIVRFFNFCINTINVLKNEGELPVTALRFYLQGGYIANKINFVKSAEICYEFISKAFSVYEEDISESKEQVQGLTLIIATIQQITCLTDDSHEPLRNQCALYATKLIKRPDQAKLVCLSARLFWFSKVSNKTGQIQDAQRVVECLKKALKISSQCMEDIVQISLYVYILAEFFYYYQENCDKITLELIYQISEKIRDLFFQLDPLTDTEQLQDIFNNTFDRIQQSQQKIS